MYLATYIEDIVDIINSLNNAYLDEYEFMFFVSFLGKNYNGKNLTKDMIINYINEFRNLRARKKIAIEHIANYCNPKNFTGGKINKRDFHNWNNGAQTIFENLNMLGVLEYDKERKSITIRKKFNGEKIKFKRSPLVKKEYFKNHKVNKNEQFELHHIIPFYLIKDTAMLKAIDNWKNLIYIDAKSHKTLSINKKVRLCIRLSFKDKNAVLDNLSDYSVELKADENIKYDTSLQKTLLDYNDKLI